MQATDPEPISRTYLFVMAVCAPLVRWWGRLSVSGAEHIPVSGPLLIVSGLFALSWKRHQRRPHQS